MGIEDFDPADAPPAIVQNVPDEFALGAPLTKQAVGAELASRGILHPGFAPSALDSAQRLGISAPLPLPLPPANKPIPWGAPGSGPSVADFNKSLTADPFAGAFDNLPKGPQHNLVTMPQGGGEDGGSLDPNVARLLTSPGGSMIAAHEVRKVSPEAERLAKEGLTKEEKAAEALTVANQHMIAAQQAAAEDKGRFLQQAAGWAKQREDARKGILNQYETDQKKMMDDIRESKVDPQEAFGTGFGGALNRVFAVIATSLGGFAAGLRGGPNMAAEMIEHRIQDSINIQKGEIEKKRGLLQDSKSMLGQKMAQFGDERVAEAAMKADGLAAAEAFAQGQIASAKSDVEKANGDALLAAIAEKRAKYQNEMFGWQGPTMGGGDPRRKRFEEMADKLLASGKMVSDGQGGMRPMTSNDALGIAAHQVYGLAGSGATGVAMPPKGGGRADKGLPSAQATQISKAKNVVRIIDEELAIREGTGRYANMSEADRMALSAKNRLSLSNDIVAYQTGGVPDQKSKDEKYSDLPTSRGRLQRLNTAANPLASDPLEQLRYEKQLALDAIKGIRETNSEARNIGGIVDETAEHEPDVDSFDPDDK